MPDTVPHPVVFFLCLGGAFFLLISGIYHLISLIYGKVFRMNQRIQDAIGQPAFASSHLTLLLKRSVYAEKNVLQNLLVSWSGSRFIFNHIYKAGLAWTVATFLRVSLITAGTSFLMGFYVSKGLGLALTFSSLGAIAPFLYLSYRSKIRAAQLERQLPEILDWIARALRAGQSLNMALTLASQDAAEPLGQELKLAVEALRYGQSMEDCLYQLARNISGTDMQFVVIAVLVQRETGGNLAELLMRVASTIRGRLMLKAQIKSQAAEGKLSAYILTALPLMLLVWIAYAQPSALWILVSDPLGQKLLGLAVTALLLGTYWVWSISRAQE